LRSLRNKIQTKEGFKILPFLMRFLIKFYLIQKAKQSNDIDKTVKYDIIIL